jgi:release factor glutamine methyltransferase
MNAAVEESGGVGVVTIEGALQQGAGQLSTAGITQPRMEAEWLLADHLGCGRLELYRRADEPLPDHLRQRFVDALRRRMRGEPMQYVRGREEFYGVELAVSPAVLIPRPETELLAEQAMLALRALGQRRAGRFADIGTGSGCVAIAVASHVPESDGVAVDCSAKALAVARQNIERHALAARITLHLGDLCAPLQARGEAPFDVMVANLPYVPTPAIAALSTEVRDHEPRLALDGGIDGLTVIGRLLRSAPPHLAAHGRLLIEIGAGQSGEVVSLARASGWSVRAIVPDLAGIDRVVVLSVGTSPLRMSSAELKKKENVWAMNVRAMGVVRGS